MALQSLLVPPAPDANSILGRALWPRETPKIMMEANGDIPLAAVTCPPAAVIDSLFKTLLRVRQAEFEAQTGVHNPVLQSLVSQR